MRTYWLRNKKYKNQHGRNRVDNKRMENALSVWYEERNENDKIYYNFWHQCLCHHMCLN